MFCDVYYLHFRSKIIINDDVVGGIMRKNCMYTLVTVKRLADGRKQGWRKPMGNWKLVIGKRGWRYNGGMTREECTLRIMLHDIISWFYRWIPRMVYKCLFLF